MLAGQITLDSTGTQRYDVGVTPTMVEFICGSTDAAQGDDGVYYSNGVATDSYQGNISITAKDGTSPSDKTIMTSDRVVWVRKKVSGSLSTVLRADFVEFDGTEIVLNVITANANYPVQLRIW